MFDPSIGLVLNQAISLAVHLAGPPLVASLATGLVISLLQAVTQINEPSLIFLPKIVAVGGTMMVLGGYSMTLLAGFSHTIFTAMIHTG